MSSSRAYPCSPASGRDRQVTVALLLSFLFLSPATAGATAFVPMPVEDLARSSVAVVIGHVVGLTGVQSHNGKLYTLVSVAVEQVLKGELPAAVITLKEDGGSVAGRQEVLFGTPSFEVGERVLLFLSVRTDGSLRTNQLALGKFRIEIDAAGMPQAVQHFGPGTMAITPAGPTSLNPAVPLDALLEVLQRTDSTSATAASVPAPRIEPPEASDSSLPHEVNEAFTLLGSGRFFEPDEGMPLSFLIDESGDAVLGLTTARQAVDNALATWTNVATASITLEDAGLTADVSAPCPGPHVVRFNDPDGEIPPPVSCSGTLAVGGFCSNAAETKVFNGTTFQRALRARLTFADGWRGCSVWTACSVAEIAAHELGHSIGLGHSSENPFEPSAALRDATMYFRAHFDGRCASLRGDDVDGISFIYPTAIPPTITTPNPLPDGVVLEPYSVTMTATGGTGFFSWELASGGFPGLNLDSAGVISGLPTATGTGTLFVRAIDENGDNHTKRFDLTVSDVSSCVGDCSGNGTVTVDEILTGVNIALGGVAVDQCPSLDVNHDNAVTVDELLTAVNNALAGCS